jgi:hypothetical protein
MKARRLPSSDPDDLRVNLDRFERINRDVDGYGGNKGGVGSWSKFY